MGVVLHGWRHHQPYTQDAADVDEAVNMAFWAIEDETFAPHDVRSEAGDVILDAAALQTAMDQLAETL